MFYLSFHSHHSSNFGHSRFLILATPMSSHIVNTSVSAVGMQNIGLPRQTVAYIFTAMPSAQESTLLGNVKLPWAFWPASATKGR